MPEPSGKNMRLSNGWREPKFLLSLAVIVVSVIVGFTSLKGTVQHLDEQARAGFASQQKQIDSKVSTIVHNECMKRMDNRLDEIAARQERIENKLDRALEK